MKQILPLIALAYLTLASSSAMAPASVSPEESNRGYLRREWTTEDGLPQNSVTAIVQTRDGYLWLGTFGGFARFDGVKFTPFNSQNTPGLKSDRILSLFEDGEGSLWIGTESGGLTRYGGGTFTNFTTNEGLPGNSVGPVCEDGAGRLWVATANGLARFQSGKFTVYTTGDGLPHDDVTTLYPQRDGSLWLGTRTAAGGLTRFFDGRFTTYPLPPGQPDDWVMAIGGGRDESLWVRTRKRLFRFEDGTFSAAADAYLSGVRVTIPRDDREGDMWVVADEENSYSIQTRSVSEDREGNIWVGTNENGLRRLSKRRISVYPTEPELAGYGVVPITEDQAENLWIGANCGGVVRLDRGTGKSAPLKLRNQRGCVWSLLAARDGSLWIGTWGGGLSRLKDDVETTYTYENGSLSSDVVLSLYQDGVGTVWVGTADGLHRFKDERFIRYRTPDGLVHNDVRFITEDHAGALWVGTVGGMSRFKDGRFTNYTTETGLAHNFVRAIHADLDGTLWVGTYGGGLSRLKDGRFVHYNTRSGLSDDFVSRILEDDQGNFWMSSNRGIFRVDRKELNDLADEKIRTITSVSYGAADGMRTSECNGGGQPAGWRTRDGKLWFATIKGAAVIDPRETNEMPPEVAIEGVSLDAAALDLRGRAEAPAGDGDLEVRYTGLSFIAPEKVRFRYKLEGYDEDWVDAGTRRVAYYTKIPPGRYRFRVLASNSDGVWNETGAAYELYLRPHFYQTKSFYALCGLWVVLLGVGGYRLRVRHLVRRTRALETKVSERTVEIAQQRNKLAEANDQLGEVNEKLERSNEDMLSTLNQLRLGVIITDKHGEVTFLSESAQHLINKKSSDEVVGRPWEEVLPLREHDLAQLKASARLPARHRGKLPVHVQAGGGRPHWIEIEVQDDPRDTERKIFCLYDVSEVYDLRNLLDERAKFHDLVGESAAMRLVYKQIQDVAPSRRPC